MLDFSQSELGALYDLLQHFHPNKKPLVIEDRLAFMTKGCKFHWLQQVERVAKALEKGAGEVQRIKDRFAGLAETTSKERVIKAMEDHLREYPQSKDWVKFWTRPSVRRMAFRSFSEVSSWDKLPTTNNICEAQHSVLRLECSSKSYSMVIKNLWQCDFASFLCLAAADMGVSRRWDAASRVAQAENNVKRIKDRAEQRSRLSRGRPKDRADEFERDARRIKKRARTAATGDDSSMAIDDYSGGGIATIDNSSPTTNINSRIFMGDNDNSMGLGDSDNTMATDEAVATTSTEGSTVDRTPGEEIVKFVIFQIFVIFHFFLYYRY